jgi:hypothetical protein
VTDVSSDPESYSCKICGASSMADKTALVDHLRNEHEILEVASYTATTMMHEEERDRIASEYFKQLEQIKKEIASG